MVAIQIDPRDMRKLDRALSDIKNGVPKAVTPAINRTLAKGRTELRREIRKEYTIKQKDIPVVLHKASYNNLSGDIRIDQGMLPLDRFELRPRGIQRKKRLIFARVKKGRGGYLRHAFFIPQGGPYKRLGPERYPIARLVTISAAIMASQPAVQTVVGKAMNETLAQRINHEMNRILQNAGKHP